MNRNLLPVLLSVAALFMAGAGCGSPEVPAPDSLEVVHRSLAGAVNVPLGATPKVYFNGDVDSASVTAASVYLESGNLAGGEGTCESPWSAAAGQATVEGAMVTLTPDAVLQDTSCYRLTCTTALRGTDLGPLRALPCNPDEQDSCRRDVGAEQTFWTLIP